MLVELAVADAYGAGFEFAPTAFVKESNDLVDYKSFRPGREGRYTDDTQMSIALAEVIVSETDFTREALADAFVQAYKRDPRAGYARGFRQFLEDVVDGEDFLEKIKPESRRCGAAMRAAPLGVFADCGEVKEKAEIQAALTHDTLIGRRSAAAAALMSHYLFHRVGKKKSLPRFLEKYVAGSWKPNHAGHVSMQGCQVVRAALTAVVKGSSMSEILKYCVAYTGDVDTVAAIALAVASTSEEVSQDLPAALVQNLEDGEFGRTFLEKLDDELMIER